MEKQIITDYIKLLIMHDWYYHFRHDGRRYNEGLNQAQEIKRLRLLIDLKYGKLGTILYNMNNPVKNYLNESASK